MRFADVRPSFTLPAKVNLVWHRITFSRLTLLYFIFSAVHFIIQLSLQVKAFTINDNAAHLLSSIIAQSSTTNDSLPFLSGSTLRMCSWVPLDIDVHLCPIVWQAPEKGESAADTESTTSSYGASSTTSSSSASSSSTSGVVASTLGGNLGISATLKSAIAVPSQSRVHETITVFVPALPTAVDNGSANTRLSSAAVPTPSRFPFPPTQDGNDSDDDEGEESDDNEDEESDDDEGDLFRFVKRDALSVVVFEQDGQVKANISGDGHAPSTLDSSCLWALNWPVSVLDNTKREDIVFIAFQFWVLGMSVVALMNESIPHIFASLLTHIMATAWASFQIGHTANFRSSFSRIVTNGACKGVSLLPNYWDTRKNAEISSLALNIISMFISCFLTWKLIKLFGWQTFKRVGASLIINRIYKVALSLSIAIQLSLFFIVVTVSLWIDQLFNSTIGDLADFQTLYKVTSFITLGLLIPWLMTGWFAVRREMRVPMFFFLMLSILYLAGWGTMFFSTTFRWTFITWRFFSIMACASVFLTLASFVLGVVCRFNFGKGLLRYLNAQQSLPEEDFPDYSYGSDIEKVNFPSNEKPIPTYSVAFGPGPNEMFAARGPRFYNKSAEPFETSSQSPGSSIVAPPLAVTRNLTDGLNQSAYVQRSSSHGSTKSSGSLGSYSVHSWSNTNHTRSDSQFSDKKRWVIE
ncbi:hypothetical protein BDQ12DRAFT_685918 [Crucibulum laeve]|uniref:Uncharacterized protein n=1 Tax=Crucibulum laeve TaxID=68775 RepID=A0A5C3LUE1_9AGAR|nr:hypothetical protein BDQ12DRAFT_685918 [Crucibulum laeve]